jgi:hypothetical protein
MDKEGAQYVSRHRQGKTSTVTVMARAHLEPGVGAGSAAPGSIGRGLLCAIATGSCKPIPSKETQCERRYRNQARGSARDAE